MLHNIIGNTDEVLQVANIILPIEVDTSHYATKTRTPIAHVGNFVKKE